MSALTRSEALQILCSLTREEQAIVRDQAQRLFNDGRSLNEMIRLPLEEVARLRKLQGGAE